MKPATKYGIWAAVAVVIAVGAYLWLAGPRDGGQPTFIRMVSGPAGGSWYPLGAKIAQVLDQEIGDISTSNGPGGGVINVREVNQGNVQMGFSYSNAAYDGFHARGKFDAEQDDIRHFATLYPAALQTAVPASSDIRTYQDLADRNISPGKPGWSGTRFTQAVLDAYGITFASIKSNGGTVHHVDYADSVALMKDGHIDAFMGLTSVPQASFIDLNFEPGIRFLPITEAKMEQVQAEHPGFVRTEIPTTAYEGLEAPVPTLGAVTVMLVHKDLPEDLVYRMAKVFWDHHEDFRQVKRVWEQVKLEDALFAAPVPVHPGAQRYYDEVGVEPRPGS